MKKFFYNYFYNSSEFRIAASFFIPLIILYQGFKQALVRVNFPALFLYAMLVVLDIALLLVRLKLSVFDKKFWAGFQKKEADYNGETVVFRQNGNIVLFCQSVPERAIDIGFVQFVAKTSGVPLNKLCFIISKNSKNERKPEYFVIDITSAALHSRKVRRGFVTDLNPEYARNAVDSLFGYPI